MDDCAEMHTAVLSTHTIDDFFQELLQIAARQVGEGASCGMTIRQGERLTSAAATDPVAASVDEAQYRINDGPCLQAMRDGEVVTVDDAAWRTRWPESEAQAAAAGIRSCLAVPVPAASGGAGAAGSAGGDTGAGAVAVLSLYGREKAAFGKAEARRAEEFAERASGALAIAGRLTSYAELNEQLRASLVSRPVIDQALGIVMAREKCSQSEAFAILRNASQNCNTKLRDLAARVVTDVTGVPIQPTPFELSAVLAGLSAVLAGLSAVLGVRAGPGVGGTPSEPSAVATVG